MQKAKFSNLPLPIKKHVPSIYEINPPNHTTRLIYTLRFIHTGPNEKPTELHLDIETCIEETFYYS